MPSTESHLGRDVWNGLFDLQLVTLQFASQRVAQITHVLFDKQMEPSVMSGAPSPLRACAPGLCGMGMGSFEEKMRAISDGVDNGGVGVPTAPGS